MVCIALLSDKKFEWSKDKNLLTDKNIDVIEVDINSKLGKSYLKEFNVTHTPFYIAGDLGTPVLGEIIEHFRIQS